MSARVSEFHNLIRLIVSTMFWVIAGSCILEGGAHAQKYEILSKGEKVVEGVVVADAGSFVSFECGNPSRQSVSITGKDFTIVNVVPAVGERCLPHSMELVGEVKYGGGVVPVRGVLHGRLDPRNRGVALWSGSLISQPVIHSIALEISRLAVVVRRSGGARNVTSPPVLEPSVVDTGFAVSRCELDSNGGLTGVCSSSGTGPECDKLRGGCAPGTSRCTSSGRCSPVEEGGYGQLCKSATDCLFETYCSRGKCVLDPFRQGVKCSRDEDCQSPRCQSTNGECMLGGVGTPCRLGHSMEDCSRYTCDSRGRCSAQEIGGDLSQIPCSAGSPCRKTTGTECLGGKCIEAPKSYFQRCDSDEMCAAVAHCDGAKCVAGLAHSDERTCNADSDCTSKTCDIFSGDCVVGAGTASCSNGEECRHLRCWVGTCVRSTGPGPNGCAYEGAPCHLSPAHASAADSEVKISKNSLDNTTSTKMDRAMLGAPSSLKEEKFPPPSEVLAKLSKIEPSLDIGDSDAPITMAIFHDLHCGQCKRFTKENWESLTEDYIDEDKVRVQVYEFPLVMNKEVARHVGALCAGKQDEYEAYMVGLNALPHFEVTELAAKVKELDDIDFEEWEACMTDPREAQAVIEKHIALGKELGVNGTPTIFIDGKAVPNFKAEVTRALQEGLERHKNG